MEGVCDGKRAILAKTGMNGARGDVTYVKKSVFDVEEDASEMEHASEAKNVTDSKCYVLAESRRRNTGAGLRRLGIFGSHTHDGSQYAGSGATGLLKTADETRRDHSRQSI